MLRGRRVIPVPPDNRFERAELPWGHARSDGAPQVVAERKDEVHAARGHVRGAEFAECGQRLIGRDTWLQVELEEPVGVRALGEDPELRQRELTGLAPITLLAHRNVFDAHLTLAFRSETYVANSRCGYGAVTVGGDDVSCVRFAHQLRRAIWITAAVGIASSAPRTPRSAAPARTETIVTIGLTCSAFP